MHVPSRIAQCALKSHQGCVCVYDKQIRAERTQPPPILPPTSPKSAVGGKVKPSRQRLSGLLSPLEDVGGLLCS